MRHLLLIPCSIALCSLLAGCLHADLPYNDPSQQKLRLDSPTPQAYTLQVGSKADVPVGPDGRITLDIPRIGRGYATYLFGFAKVSERSADDVATILLKNRGRTIRTLSLSYLKTLPVDSRGYSIL